MGVPSYLIIDNETDRLSIIRMLISSISYPNPLQIKKEMARHIRNNTSLSVNIINVELKPKLSDFIPLYTMNITKEFCLKENLFNEFYYYSIDRGRLLDYDIKLEKFLTKKIALKYLNKMYNIPKERIK